MLIRIIKNALEKRQESLDSRGPFPDAEERSVVVVVYGISRSDPFKNMAKFFSQMYADLGLHCHVIDMPHAPWPNHALEALLRQNQVRYGIGWGGIGHDIRLSANGESVNAWSATDTPFFKLIGDHPAYFLDLNYSPSSNFVNVYGYSEHRDFFVRHFRPPGYAAVFPITPFDPIDADKVDFRAKQSGAIVFLKNGNDPERLRRDWQAQLPAAVSGALLSMAEDLLSTVGAERAWRIESLVVEHFGDAGIDVAAKLKWLSFYCAQLDDYLRRVKSRMIAESLLDFPIEVHGECWEYLDFHGRKAKLIPYGNYAKSTQLITDALCVLDMAPNTRSQPHERFVRCASRHTLCLTNQIDFLEHDYARFGQPLFDFTPDSIRAHVAAVLDDPARHVEIGRAVGAEFTSRYPRTALVDFCEAMAQQVRTIEGDAPGVQGFFIWPPKKIA